VKSYSCATIRRLQFFTNFPPVFNFPMLAESDNEPGFPKVFTTLSFNKTTKKAANLKAA
jgi:hypothetical protein